MDTSKKFLIWKRALIVGLCLYPFIAGYFLLGSITITSGGNVSAKSEVISWYFNYATILAVFVSVICLITALYFSGKGKDKQAIFLLRFPFFYGLFCGVLFFLI